ncbi:MAG TPA: hypothetical protein VFL83_13020 [Anaeromyxobacter sp.]|nr:hypothetical protein [Anaeromyxobacter sp.]
MLRTLAAAVAAAALAVPARAQVSLGLELTIPAQRLGMTHAPGTDRPLAAMGDAGATLLLRAGPLGLGAGAEGFLSGGSVSRYDASLLGGLVADLLPVLRLELLGELGAANLQGVADLRRAAAGEMGRFYGVRPGLSAKLPGFPLRVGVWGLARWGMPGAGAGPALGLLGRVGLEF